MTANVAELNGAYVRSTRERYRMSRAEFVKYCELAGVSRLYNIEVNDSWKPGDRELVVAGLERLLETQAPEGGARRVGVRAQPRESRSTHRSMASTSSANVVTFDPCFEDDEHAWVSVQDLPSRPLVDLPVPIYGTSVLDVPDGTYVISNSEIETWKRCPRKWWLGWYRQLMLRARSYTGPLATGDRVHRALACWYVPDGQQRVDPRDALERIIVDDWTVIAADARERGLGEEQLAELAGKFQDANSLERAMVDGYVQWIEETGADSEYRIVGAEQAIYWDTEVDPYQYIYGGPEDPDAPEARPIRIIGRLDTRVVRNSDDVRLFVDHKTVADMTSPRKTLHGNPQMLTYMILEWLNTPEGEARCDGALYNMLRKVKRTQRANPPFYDRVESRHNVHELEAHKRELLTWTRQVLRAVDALNAGADPHDVVPRSWRDDCSWSCDYFPICPMFDDGSRVEDAVTGLYERHDPRLRYNDLERFEPPNRTST